MLIPINNSVRGFIFHFMMRNWDSKVVITQNHKASNKMGEPGWESRFIWLTISYSVHYTCDSHKGSMSDSPPGHFLTTSSPHVISMYLPLPHLTPPFTHWNNFLLLIGCALWHPLHYTVSVWILSRFIGFYRVSTVFYTLVYPPPHLCVPIPGL